MKTIILDHDAGTNPDDFFSLLMLLNAPDVDLRLVISGNNYPMERARFAHKIVAQHGKKGVMVCRGEDVGHIEFNAQEYIEGYEPSISNDYLTATKEILQTADNVTYVAIQGLSNLATILRMYPQYHDAFDIVHMGMKIEESAEFISGGTNMEADALAAKYVYELGLKKFKVVGSHTTINDSIRITPETDLYKKLEHSSDQNHTILLQHLHDYYDRRNIWPALHEPFATSVALEWDFVSFKDYIVEFDSEGKYKQSSGGVQVSNSCVEISEPERFMRMMTELV